MSLDKTLWKALRAGGLGHKAATLLADDNSRYHLGPMPSLHVYDNGGHDFKTTTPRPWLKDDARNEDFNYEMPDTSIQSIGSTGANTQASFNLAATDCPLPDISGVSQAFFDYMTLADRTLVPFAFTTYAKLSNLSIFCKIEWVFGGDDSIPVTTQEQLHSNYWQIQSTSGRVRQQSGAHGIVQQGSTDPHHFLLPAGDWVMTQDFGVDLNWA